MKHIFEGYKNSKYMTKIIVMKSLLRINLSKLKLQSQKNYIYKCISLLHNCNVINLKYYLHSLHHFHHLHALEDANNIKI